MNWGERAAANAAESERFIVTQLRRHGYDDEQIRSYLAAVERARHCTKEAAPGSTYVVHDGCCGLDADPTSPQLAN